MRQLVLFGLTLIVEATWLPEHGDPTQPQDGLHDVLQPLADEFGVDVGQPRNIAAWMRQAGHGPAGNGDEDNGYGLGCLFGGEGGECASSRHDDIKLESD